MMTTHRVPRPTVLLVTKDFHPVIGGVATAVRSTAGLLHDEFRIMVLAVNEGDSPAVSRAGGYCVVKTARLGTVLSTPLSVALVPTLQRLASRVDIIHCHAPYPPAELVLTLMRLTARLVVSYHFDVVRQRVLIPAYRPLLRALFRRADAITTYNPVMVSSSPVLREFRSKVLVIPPGVNSADFGLTDLERDAVATRRQQFRRPLVLFVGRLVYYKGVDILIRALVRVNADLVIIGRGALEIRLRRLASSLGLADRVTFLAPVTWPELLRWYHSCDVLVLPSVARTEAFGLVLLEAMACGKPVVSTELSTGTSWVNRHEETGLVVPPSDPDALARAITRLVSEPALARKFGAAARQRATEDFGAEACARSYASLYRRLL